MIHKIVKNKTLIAWFAIFAVVISLGTPAWSDDVDDYTDEGDDEAVNAPKETYDVPWREEDYLWNKMEYVTSNNYLELRVIENYEYTGRRNYSDDVSVYTQEGHLLEYTADMFDGLIPIYDEEGNYVESRDKFGFTEVAIDGSDAVNLTYRGTAYEPDDKVKQEGKFAVKNKSNGYIWWSTPVNASLDTIANELMVNNLSSPITFRASNHVTYSPANVYSNTIQNTGGTPANHNFVNALTGITKFQDGSGARFHYDFAARSTKMAMDITLDGKSIVVTIPESELVESDIYGDRGSVMLTLSLLSSFGATPEGEGGYVVVPDGSGAIINFDNNKVNSAQYAGQVYGRDFSVSQKFAPPVHQQVYLPVYGIVRDDGNGLVAIAEKGDENATVRAAVSRQGSRNSGDALANHTTYNLAWFDFTMRTTDTFRIGTADNELQIYEAEKIKTGDIVVRYFPLAGEDLSYVDVAHTYRNYLMDTHASLNEIAADNTVPLYVTLNGGTIKRHSIVGFPVNMQTKATSYADAEKIIDSLKAGGVDELVIVFNDFNTSSIRREVSTTAQYSKMLGGKSGFQSLMTKANNSNATLYPSLGFMEFSKSGRGYVMLLHSARQVTRSRSSQLKYELAFGTPDPLQRSSTILTPHYFPNAFDNITSSLSSEGIKNVSLDQATSMLYSDFSRKNPSGNIYYNRRDTVEVLTNGYSQLNNAGISIMAQRANAYALPYVSHISNVPMFSSNYDIFDYDVPFYQIVIQGMIPYSATPFNAAPDLNALTLLALSTGTPLHYEYMYADAGDFNDSDYNKKFYASFNGWLDDTLDMYNMFNELVADVVNTRIVSHARVTSQESGKPGVNQYETVFEGGKTIWISLDTNEIEINGNAIDLSQYRGGGR
jgi:hypothetical protein